jgi:hypothetical protein
MQLLRQLIDSLSTNLRAYKRFDAPDGDKCYFADIVDPDVSLLRNSIKESFEQMTDLHLELTSLDDSCKRFATHVRSMYARVEERLTRYSLGASSILRVIA